MARPSMPPAREGFKTCTGCLAEKQIGEFDFEPRVKSQTTAKCRACLRVYRAAWSAAHPGKVEVSRRKYREKYPERVEMARQFTNRRIRLERLEKRLEEGRRIDPVVTPDGRRCPKCRARKPLDEFSSNGWCRPCHASDALKRLQSLNPEKREKRRRWFRKYDTERLYGVPFEKLQERLDRQEGKCAICCDPIDLMAKRSGCVDHCHATNQIRGILCVKCNAGLGQFRDDVSFLERAIGYLKTQRSIEMRLSDHERAQGGTVTISVEQWEKLVELLTPGYTLAKMYLDQQQQKAAAESAGAADSAGDQNKSES